ncbi:gustatory receptor Gr82 isoform X1 [Tribolium castaneum]|uniref:Inorganic phosphate cotransporter-like Protein n=1 Tax=Tribolium castaneum TaxID=7070 RepID=D6WK72_TRICA|nr:PREDICTED: gustatory receptor Gr82 isoform X1 [Tribolium castaneum]EFA03944.1 Putative inorganic phosphate cotransporter-like Protein [Tribolium castaneum]|eukprot:XP_008193168.1 PREDICTED: gustatory receptor Gr82 isoform X1 [Tribolium castaneum]
MPTREILSCTQILFFMVLTSFMIHHMLRVNIAIAIVEMVVKPNTTTPTEENFGPKYAWNEREKNDLFAWFFWGFLITQIPGGRFSEIVGSRIVLGLGILVASVATLLLPLCCNVHYYLVVASRFCVGLGLGVHWPAIPPIAIRWSSSATARTMFMTHLFAGSLGAAIVLPVSGHLIAYVGWPSVFYVTGGMGVLWSVMWFYLIYDSPGQHPRISAKEKEILEQKIRNEITPQVRHIPWIKIFTSLPVWAIVVANASICFGFYIIFNHLPTYMSSVHNVEIEKNGWISSLPHLGRYITTVAVSYLGARMLHKNKFSTLTIRKFLSVVCSWSAVLLFGMEALFGYHYYVTNFVSITFFLFLSLSIPGMIVNILDISPAFSGTIIGFNQVIVCLSGITSAKVVAFFTATKQSFEQWRYVFIIVAIVNFVGGLFFLIFASADVQSWNPKENVSQKKNTLLNDTTSKDHEEF